MSVVAGSQSLGPHRSVESGDKLGQPFGRDCGVLDKCPRLGIAVHRHQQAQTGLAHLPHPRLRGRVGLGHEGVSHALRFEFRLNGPELVVEVGVGVREALD